MLDLIGKKVLITTNSWFVAPDGLQYRAAYGELKAIHEAGKALGFFIPNRSRANWFIEVGKMKIMGCQVMYVIESEEKPNLGIVTDFMPPSNGQPPQSYERPTMIYCA